jgi:hypothetical protein
MRHPPGKRGLRGLAGPRGHPGRRGARGAIGPEGPAGRSERPAQAGDLLEIVERQIDDIHRELDVQLNRIAQIQEQVDDLRATVRRLLPSPPTS